MPKASPPKVRRFDAILLDHGHETRAAFCATLEIDSAALARLINHGYGPERMRDRIAKALDLSRAELDAVIAHEVSICAARRAAKAGAR